MTKTCTHLGMIFIYVFVIVNATLMMKRMNRSVGRDLSDDDDTATYSFQYQTRFQDDLNRCDCFALAFCCLSFQYRWYRVYQMYPAGNLLLFCFLGWSRTLPTAVDQLNAWNTQQVLTLFLSRAETTYYLFILTMWQWGFLCLRKKFSISAAVTTFVTFTEKSEMHAEEKRDFRKIQKYSNKINKVFEKQS